MNKNLMPIILAVLVLVAAAEAAYIHKLRGQRASLADALGIVSKAASENDPSNRPKPTILAKGMKLADNPIAQNAYKIAPDVPDDTAKKAMTGFNMTSQPQKDGSVIVNLFPKDDDDQKQQYTVKKGQTLYFIEQTPGDDQADQDKDLNYRDDYGVIVDGNGIVQ
jgi:hypothetical protein